MQRRFITDVYPMDDYILQVAFVSGSHVLLDMKPLLDSVRFCQLKDLNVWRSATANGMFVQFGNIELSHDEILIMLETPRKCDFS